MIVNLLKSSDKFKKAVRLNEATEKGAYYFRNNRLLLVYN